MDAIPCLLCGRKLEKRTSRKNGKPYFVCDPCGIQLFVRRKQGIQRLEQFFKNADKAEIPYKQHAQKFHEIQAILKEIADVESEIDKLGFCLFNDHKLHTRKALETRVESLFYELERFAENKDVDLNQIRNSKEI
jgi:chaperonin cofactor prefoldin